MPQAGDLPYKGDTVMGNDVWIGYNALIMPGVTIGNGEQFIPGENTLSQRGSRGG